MRVLFVNLLLRCVEHVNGTRSGLNRFGEPNPHRVRYLLYLAANGGFSVIQKCMRVGVSNGYAAKHQHQTRSSKPGHRLTSFQTTAGLTCWDTNHPNKNATAR